MCGVAGFFNWPSLGGESADACALRMARALGHRGPDEERVWSSADGALRFAHRRLAVLDLTAAGRQPMRSADGRWRLCFNGEIYNHEAMRGRLREAGLVLRGRADTEALLESIARFGLEQTVDAAEGMFAFALWDERERRLHLVRDRVGVKPLYWIAARGGVAFASEIKAFQALPHADFSFDGGALAAFLELGYAPAPLTLFSEVKKLEPGSILTIDAEGAIAQRRYWEPSGFAAEPRDGRSDEDLVDALGMLAERAVRQELSADVPVGCFLSGGVDSSLVAALAQRCAAGRLQTFSIGFEDPALDETAHARAVAAHLGADHRVLRVDGRAAADVIPLLPQMYDDPVADMAQIPTYLLSKLARAHVTVALSGDGGDELFAGYERYWIAERVSKRLALAPEGLRRLAARALRAAPETLVSALARIAQPDMNEPRARARFARLIAALDDASPAHVYRAATALWLEPPAALGKAAPDRRHDRSGSLCGVGAFQLIDLHSYLPDDVLAKVDRASMAVGLEARVPLLNHRLIEFALRLPDRVKRRDGRSKWLLRQVLGRYVPNALTDRPKQGFAAPMADWLRGPLKPWAGDLLSSSALRSAGLLDPAPIERRWREHLSGDADWSHALWAVLTFEAWRRHWRDDVRAAA